MSVNSQIYYSSLSYNSSAVPDILTNERNNTLKTLKKKIVAGVLGGMLMLSAVAGISAANVTAGAEQTQARKVNEYEGQHLAKVNEYEGQHRIVGDVVAAIPGGGTTGDVVIVTG